LKVKQWQAMVLLGAWCGAATIQAAEPIQRIPTHAVRIPAGLAEGVAHTSAIDYGAYVWMELTDAELDALRATDTAQFATVSGYELDLGGQRFDPLRSEPTLPAELASGRADGPDLRLVQMRGPTKPAWLAGLRAEGLEVVQFIPPHTYVVWGTQASCNAAAQRAEVRWTGEFAPAYRVLPRYRNTRAARDTARALIYRGADEDVLRQTLAARGLQIGGTRVLDDRFAVVSFESDAAGLASAAQVPGVYSVQPVPRDGGLRGEMSNQVCVNNIDGSNIAFPGYESWLSLVGLSGAGVTIANVDSGIDQGHPDLVGRMLPCAGTTCGDSASSGHGTHTAGIMAADGASGVTDSFGFLRGLGMAPGAELVEQVYSPHFQQAGGMLLLIRDSYANGAQLSGNSWGPAGTPQGYDNDTMQVDIGVRDADVNTPGNQQFTYVLSIMNGNGSGSGGVGTQGTPDEAKNIFTIGSTKLQNTDGTQDTDINDVSANSAHGPALDGRIIPHMVAPGCYVDSTVPGGYAIVPYCGTSMASPHVSGAIALFIEYWRSLSGYVADPTPAMIKAAFTAVAIDLAGNADADGGIMGHPFDDRQGWGRMDAEAVLDPQQSVRYFDAPVVLDNSGEEWVAIVAAENPLEPVRIMLVWTDAPGHGLGGSTPAWNNDLDLIVEAGANTYLGNNFGGNGYSVTGGAPDGKNNTEGVFLLNPGAGPLTVRVAAASINSDAIPGEGDGTDQDFALVCYNCAAEDGFILRSVPIAQDVCAPADASYVIDVEAIGGFADQVTLSTPNLPVGASASFSVNPVPAGGSSLLTVGNTGALAPDNYAFDVQGDAVSTVGVRTIGLHLGVVTATPGTPDLLAPTDGAIDVGLASAFVWLPAAQAEGYVLEVADDAGFANVVYQESLTDVVAGFPAALTSSTTYHWRVTAVNTCGLSAASSAWSFTTADKTGILLVDDDDNAPDVRGTYTAVLDALGVSYDVWDTGNGVSEPDAATLVQYHMVLWFSADAFGFGAGEAGPTVAGEAELATFLDGGGCLMISSQDYHFDRGLTSFMTNYLGVASVTNDQEQTSVTGSGGLLSGLGPFSLSYPFNNYSDIVQANAGGEVSFVGDQGNAAINRDNGVYRTSFWAFPFEALPTFADRVTVMDVMVDWCGAYPPPVPGDHDGDGDVDLADFAAWHGCMTGPNAGPPSSGCEVFDFDADDDVDTEDFQTFSALLGV
jgi:serine protease AprX